MVGWSLIPGLGAWAVGPHAARPGPGRTAGRRLPVSEPGEGGGGGAWQVAVGPSAVGDWGRGAPVTGGGGSGPGPAACSLQVESGRLWPWERRGGAPVTGAGDGSCCSRCVQPAGREGAAADLPFAYLGLAAG